MYIENTDCSVKSLVRQSGLPAAAAGVVPCCEYKIPRPRRKELDSF